MPKELLNGLRILYGLLLIPAVNFFLLSGMLYDHPCAGGIFTDSFAFSIMTFPLSLILSIILSFIKPKFIWLPVFNIMLFVIALVCINAFQGGRFVPPQ